VHIVKRNELKATIMFDLEVWGFCTC